jgi:hypothetical protein
MQVLPQAGEAVSLHQKQLNEFQDECLEMLDTDEHTLSALRDLVDDHGVIDGVITVTHPTKTYMKHLRAQGVKLKNNKPIISYIPMKTLVDETRHIMNAQLASILSHYQQLSPEQKKTTFLFRFQLPYSYNPSQALQNYYFVENLDLTPKSNSTVNKEDQDQEECKDSATRKEQFKRNRRLDRKKLNSFFY